MAVLLAIDLQFGNALKKAYLAFTVERETAWFYIFGSLDDE